MNADVPALLITVDTNLLDRDRLLALTACISMPFDMQIATPTLRERGADRLALLGIDAGIPESGVWGEARWDEAVWDGPVAPPMELFIIGETPLGAGVLAGDVAADRFEEILRIISSNSFPAPGRRDSVTDLQRRQMRDALIFDAHVRAGRHVFVSNDQRAYVNHGRRKLLEELGATHIRTPEEFIDTGASGCLRNLLTWP